MLDHLGMDKNAEEDKRISKYRTAAYQRSLKQQIDERASIDKKCESQFGAYSASKWNSLVSRDAEVFSSFEQSMKRVKKLKQQGYRQRLEEQV